MTRRPPSSSARSTWCRETVLVSGINHPNEILTILGEDGRRGHPENGVLAVVQSRRNGGSKAKVLRRIRQGDADTAHARYRIGLRRYFANLALHLNGRQQLQADGERQTDGQGHWEVRADIDHSLPDVRPRHGHDALTRRDDLSHLGAYGRDDTGEIGLDLGITQLLNRLGQVRAGASGRCLCTCAHLLCIVKRLPGRGVGLDQDPFPLLSPACVCKQSLGFREICFRRLYGEPKRRRVDCSDGLPFRDQISHVDRTCDQSPEHAEAKTGLISRLDSSDRQNGVRCGRFKNGGKHGSHRFRGSSPPACRRPAPAPTRTCRQW